jgi:hypothetical protein
VQTRFLVRAVIRIAFAVTGVVAMTYQFTRLQGQPTFNPGNFFSFFTIQSNILAVAMLVLTALVRLDERSRLFDAVRGAVTFYITITGVVFALLFLAAFAVAATAFALMSDRRLTSRTQPA